MLDIEATARAETAAIPSLGAVVFDYDNPESEFIDEFIGYFDVKKQLEEQNRTMDKPTMDWWKKQDPEIMKQQFSGTENLKDGLIRFEEWVSKYDVEWYWAKGASYDFPKIESAMMEFGMEDVDMNAKFWKRQCSASVGRCIAKSLGNQWIVNNLTKKFSKEFGNLHDPLTDSKIQVEVLKDLLLR